MDIDRRAGHAPRTRRLADGLAAQPVACIGCAGCRGLCRTLIELMTVPDAILAERQAQ